jgi:hypothetical protein
MKPDQTSPWDLPENQAPYRRDVPPSGQKNDVPVPDINPQYGRLPEGSDPYGQVRTVTRADGTTYKFDQAGNIINSQGKVQNETREPERRVAGGGLIHQ